MDKTNKISTKILFKTTKEKLLLAHRFLRDYVTSSYDIDLNLTEIGTDSYIFTFSANDEEVDYTPFTDFLFCINYIAEILMIDSKVINDKNEIEAIHQFEDGNFYSHFVSNLKRLPKRKISNYAFDEDIRFPIYTSGEKRLVEADVYGATIRCLVHGDNLSYLVNQKYYTLYICDDDSKEIPCEFCSNKLACIVEDVRSCTFIEQ